MFPCGIKIFHYYINVLVIVNIVTAYNSILLMPLTLSKCLSKEANSVMPWPFMHATTRLSSKSRFLCPIKSNALLKSSMLGTIIFNWYKFEKNTKAFLANSNELVFLNIVNKQL